MKIDIHDSGASLTESDVIEFENQYKVTIPQEYTAFLLENNGGYPNPSEFQMRNMQSGKAEWASISYFLGIGVTPSDSLEYVIRVFKHRLPSDVFPIARDPGGNLICISTNPRELGKIVFWDHEFESDSGEYPTYDNIYDVAKNFDEFIGILT